jgi:hypothetical protein
MYGIKRVIYVDTIILIIIFLMRTINPIDFLNLSIDYMIYSSKQCLNQAA